MNNHMTIVDRLESSKHFPGCIFYDGQRLWLHKDFLYCPTSERQMLASILFFLQKEEMETTTLELARAILETAKLVNFLDPDDLQHVEIGPVF